MLRAEGLLADFGSLTPIGSGSFAEAFEFRDAEGVLRCMKIWNSSKDFGIPPDAVREVQTLTALSSPHVVSILSHGWDEKNIRFFATYELMSCNLRNFISRPEFSPDSEFIKIVSRQLAQGVRYIHSEGFVHRDLNPNNVLLDLKSGFCLKIADFGLSVRLNDGSPNIMYGFGGTQRYLAPEQLSKQLNYSYETDVWSFGCIVAEICLGSPLFRAKTEPEIFQEQFKFCQLINPSEVETDSKSNDDPRFTAIIQSLKKTLGESGMVVLRELLCFDHIERKTIEEILELDFFCD